MPLELFRALTPQLIHGDIKCSNIIVDSVGKQCFIDIAAMKISYDVLNFHYQMTWNLLPENHKRRAFTKDFLMDFMMALARRIFISKLFM